MSNFETYLKIYNELKMPEGMTKEKFSNLKKISKQFDGIFNQITKSIRIQDILGYVKDNVNPFTNDSKIDNYADTIFVVFDTETTGLTQKTSVKDNGMTTERDQIYELAATAYDNDFKVIPDGTLHLKMELDKLKYQKNPTKLKNNITKKYPDITTVQMGKIKEAYKANKDGFKFNMPGFKESLATILTNKKQIDINKIAYLLKSSFEIEGLMDMTKAKKDDFKRIESWDKSKLGEGYKVERKKTESEIVDAFISFVKKVKSDNKDKKVVVVAQNLSYDQGMVTGELLDRNAEIFRNIKKFDQKKSKSLTAIKAELKRRTKGYTTRKGKEKVEDTFGDSMDTQEVFKKFVKGDKKRQQILKKFYEKIKETSGIDSKKWNKIFDNPKSSVSLGKLGAIAKNLDWHTASNDVYVTIEATKRWLAMIRLTHVLLKAKDGKTSIRISDPKRNITISQEDYPDFFQFIKDNGITDSQYEQLKQGLVPVQTAKPKKGTFTKALSDLKGFKQSEKV